MERLPLIAGNDLNVASLNRDVDKAYEITRDEEQRTDLYVTKSSLEAVSQPTTTAKEWTNQLLTYNETARKNYEDAAQGLTRAVNKIESTLGRKMDSGALGLMGAEFAESTMDSLLQSGMTRDQAMKLMGDKAFQEQVVAQIAHIAGIDFKEVEGLDQTLQASSKPNGPGAYELPDIPVTDSDKETLTLAQDTLRSMANVNVYLQNHPEQQEAVSVLVALTQGPKGLVQLAIFNAVSETPAGEAFNNKIAEYTKALGEQVASAMEGETLSENDGYDKYLIGGGLFVTAVLTGVLASGKYKAKSKTISAEMKADPYHPDWKDYSGTDRGVGADRVSAESGAKATTNAPNTPRFITDSAGNTIDLDYTKGLRETNVTVTGTRGGVQYPLQGQTPDSYANLGNGHVVVYGPEGRALYDVSSSRIKVVEWNQAPNGTYFPKKGSDTKAFEGNVPQSVLDSLGLK